MFTKTHLNTSDCNWRHPFALTAFVTLIILFSPELVQCQTFSWANNAGSAFNDEGVAIHVDNNGNILVTGYVANYAEFNGHNLGINNAFVARYDPGGNVLWATGVLNADFYGICTDSSGHVYAAGTIKDSIFLGADTLVSLITQKYAGKNRLHPFNPPHPCSISLHLLPLQKIFFDAHYCPFPARF